MGDASGWHCVWGTVVLIQRLSKWLAKGTPLRIWRPFSEYTEWYPKSTVYVHKRIYVMQLFTIRQTALCEVHL